MTEQEPRENDGSNILQGPRESLGDSVGEQGSNNTPLSSGVFFKSISISSAEWISLSMENEKKHLYLMEAYAEPEGSALWYALKIGDFGTPILFDDHLPGLTTERSQHWPYDLTFVRMHKHRLIEKGKIQTQRELDQLNKRHNRDKQDCLIDLLKRVSRRYSIAVDESPEAKWEDGDAPDYGYRHITNSSFWEMLRREGVI